MKEVFIKYNPYTVHTDFKVDGADLKENSRILELIGKPEQKRLQEWVEDLPQILVEEFNDNAFKVTFHGTLIDYEDVTGVFEDAYEHHLLASADLSRIPAKEIADKEGLIDKVFAKITSSDCPIKELNDPQIIDAFNNAKKRECDVCVVATMSSGKSTLINAMLGTKLMPSKQEACTAIITRIKDNDAKHFRAEVYHKDGTGKPDETYERVSYNIMERLNSDPEVSEIKMEGGIPFLSADKMALVLTDTPGPNNARDSSHRALQKKFLENNSQTLVLYIMTGEFGTDDDYGLLKEISDSMSVGGKKSRDRFIFVVNKMDSRKKEDGEVEVTLGKVRSYLNSHGIANPNMFPAASLPAMNIRRMKSFELCDEDELDEVNMIVKKLNRNERYHFEKYAKLPRSIREEINDELLKAEKSWTGDSLENPDTALIHTGVVSIEAAIRQYVEKYAATAKIKKIVDTFMRKLEDARSEECLKKEIATNRDECERIVKQIEVISEKIDSAKEAKMFRSKVDGAVRAVNADSVRVVEEIITEFQSRITDRISGFSGDLELREVDRVVEDLKRFAMRLEPAFKEKLQDLIDDKLQRTSADLLAEYKKKLASLPEIDGSDKIAINPLKLVGSSIVPEYFDMRGLVETKRVADGEKQVWVENTSKKWWKPWTWFQEKGYYRTETIYKDVQYVKGDKLAQEYLEPIQSALYENGDSARAHALEQCQNLARCYEDEFKKIDDIVKAKLSELKRHATDRDNAQKNIKIAESKLKWLDGITAEVNSILDI